MVALFSLAALASAFLLFWVEPFFAKLVLPLLGGSPAVWNTCLMYFQAVLLAGYLYAHLSARYLAVRRQVWLHVVLLALAFLSLPIAVPQEWTPPASGNVIPWLLLLLTVALGAPFVVLAATAPLLQRWLATSDDPAAKNPYMLYAASNAGSLLGLLAFPILMEPNLRLGQQSQLWSVGYGMAFALTVVCGALAWRSPDSPRTEPAEDLEARAPSAADRVKWVVLAFVPSSLLLGVTTYLSTDVAAVPLLWVVPLALYLLTFIIVFSRRSRKPIRPILILHALLVTTLVIVIFRETSLDLRWAYPLNLGVFAATALVLHGELAASRPSPVHLTEFYLWMALGGALGGAFNAILAPLLFNSITEYQAVVVLACFLRPAMRLRTDKLVERVPAASAVIPALLLGVVSSQGIDDYRLVGIPIGWIAAAIAAGVVLLLQGNPFRFFLSVAAIAIAGGIFFGRSRNVLYTDRSFFGAYLVQRSLGPSHILSHGTTIHGAQFLDAERRHQPVTYYHPKGPVGQLFTALQDRLQNKRIGVVGLGAGSLLCYAKPGQAWTFFEIDPLVESIARNRRLFTFLNECPVSAKVVIGDARLTLAREPEKRFALLVIDAFSSDAIPVHLLTREALVVYARVLDDHGVLFMHISNQNLELEPVVAALASDAGLVALIAIHTASEAAETRQLEYSSDWVALAARQEDLGALVTDPRWQTLAPRGARKPWTDDYSNVFGVIKW